MVIILIAQIERIESEINLIGRSYQDAISQLSTNPENAPAVTKSILTHTWHLVL
jgi:hypothetical protein